ncbi:MAG: 6-phospho-beta-glucosidase [Defluviitaleaceae bacterium]|nr:6-phospho-beta-glucosidase [Defluviitaleaceae bacterium]
MKGIKIVTIGGGSSYTPELVEGFILRYEHLPIRELWLVDIEEGKEKLEIVGALAKRMFEKAGLPTKVHLTLNRREALPGADFVTTQLRVGLLKARGLDESIPLSHGLLGQETNGAGGLFKALRTVPVILDIQKDIAELCPDAWLINFSNPAGIVTEACLRYGATNKVIGLCNVPIGIERGISNIMKIEPKRLWIKFAGLNHMVYGLNVFVDGVDILDKVINTLASPDPGDGLEIRNIDAVTYGPEFVRGLGVLPCFYHAYYYRSDQQVKKMLELFKKSGETRATQVQKVEAELFELYKDPDLAIKPPQLQQRGGAYYSDAACNLIDSIYNDKHDIQTVNTVNNGTITGIEHESAIEASCLITKSGPIPLNVGKLPLQAHGLVQQMKSFEILSAQAAIEGDIDKTITALTINPLTPSDAIAKTVVYEMLEAHKKYLPNFAGKF